MYVAYPIIIFLHITGYLRLHIITYICYIVIYVINNMLLDLEEEDELETIVVFE